MAAAYHLRPHGSQTRKCKLAPKTWAQNLRTQLCSSGQPYKNEKGVNIPFKSATTKKDCLNSCKI